MFKKIAIILIISFGSVGTGEILFQNNSFFILILICFCFWIQMKWKPFITKELNSLDLRASMIMILTIFGGLFAMICDDSNLQTILMILIILFNVYFLALFFKTYIQTYLSFAKDSKLLLSFQRKVQKYWSGGSFYFKIPFTSNNS